MSRWLRRQAASRKSPTEEEWRCRTCGTLLGICRGASVRVKHKRAQLVVRGHVMAECPRCAERNETDTTPPPDDARPAA